MIPKIMVEVTQYGICEEVWRRAVLRKSCLLKPSTIVPSSSATLALGHPECILYIKPQFIYKYILQFGGIPA